jgi:hypothetical protein
MNYCVYNLAILFYYKSIIALVDGETSQIREIALGAIKKHL